jgi:hypothetical protein
MKQIKSSTRSERAKNSHLSKSVQPSSQLVTYMIQCEAREWKGRYKAKVREIGKQNAQNWWAGVKADILRIRGQAGHDTLIAEMNRQRHDANPLPS